MSKAGKKAVDKNELPFEEALEKLESIVESMESDDLPLESLLERYEEGTKLAAVCQQKLAVAELRIKKLEQDKDGNPALTDFDNPDSAAE